MGAATTISLDRRRAQIEARMLDKAHAEGIRLYYSLRRQTWYATSSKDDGTTYDVTPQRCMCDGFTKHSYCKHWALLRAELADPVHHGDDDDPPPAAPPAVPPAPISIYHRNRDTEDADDNDASSVLRCLGIQAETAAVNDPDRQRAQIGKEIAKLARIFAEGARHAEPELTYMREWIINAATEQYRRESGDLEAA